MPVAQSSSIAKCQFENARFTPKATMCGAAIDVRFGSKAEIRAAKSHVRFTPESGHELIAYWISSLAAICSRGETVRPNA
jgi:hypothetical protein